MSAAAAQRGSTDSAPGRCQGVDQCYNDPGTRCTERVSEGNGPSVNVHTTVMDVEHLSRPHRHGGERFVNLDKVEVARCQGGLVERYPQCLRWPFMECRIWACDLGCRPFAPGLYVADVHQEHGLLAARDGATPPYDLLPVGARVRILPNHACMTAAAHNRYIVMDQGKVADHWNRINHW